MKNPAIVNRRKQTATQAQTFWNHICEQLPKDAPVQSSVDHLREGSGISDHAGSRIMRALRELDMVDYWSEYGQGFQKVMYVRKVSKAEGHLILGKFEASGDPMPGYGDGEGRPRVVKVHKNGSLVIAEGAAERQVNKHREVPMKAETHNPTVEDIIVPNSKEAAVAAAGVETVAIVGEDAPKPMAEALRPVRRDDSLALIEAARQYIDRDRAVVSKIAELEAMGITVDHEKFRSSIVMAEDPILGAVAALLPEWDRMARTVERLSADNVHLREEVTQRRRAESDARSELTKQQDANKRLSERNAQLVGERTSMTSKLSEMGISLPNA